jgi:hypothetical protein
MNNMQLLLVIEKLKQLHSEMPAKTQEQIRLKCNLFCCIVYLEDEVTP